MNSLVEASGIFCERVREFHNASGGRQSDCFNAICQTYKAILDSNFLTKFCIDGHCKTVFMVEVKCDGCKWGATPKIFYSKEEAEKEAELLKIKYPFISQCRVVTRKEREGKERLKTYP